MGQAPTHPLRRDKVAGQLLALGVEPGAVLLVHTAFSAVRPIEGGPEGLIDALTAALGPGGTLVIPSWTGDADAVFDPQATRAAPDLGVVADTFWRLPGVLRSQHPEAFAARGPRAAAILRDPLPLPPHIPESPVGRVSEVDGQVLLLGVGHEANTTLHLAELIAGVPYAVPAYVTVSGPAGPERIAYRENDHCCGRFPLADDWLRVRGLQHEGPVGHGNARLMRSRDAVAVALAALQEDPTVFLHPRGTCPDCDAAWRSMEAGPV